MAESGPPTPPQELEAERAFIGAMLLEPPLMGAYAHALPPESFHKDAHRSIWATMRDLHGASQGIDVITVRSELRRLGKFEQVGGEHLAVLQAEGQVATQLPELRRAHPRGRDQAPLVLAGGRLVEGASNGRPAMS